jgi:S-adenosylmethionine synthetase
MRHSMIFTSESVTAGHPDKLCDQLSDAAVDAYLRQDPEARVTVECAIATGVVFVAARFATHACVDLPTLARSVIADAGYIGDGFDARSCSILTSLTRAPESLRMPADDGLDDGTIERLVAEEQANAFGFACSETPVFMPLPIWLAHRLARMLDEVRASRLSWLAADGKTQVAVEYRDGRPVRLHGITLTCAVKPEAPSRRAIADALREHVIGPTVAGEPIAPDSETEIHINPGDPFLIGGPGHHAGLTGRKNGIDTYGEYARQSGAALSGKDPSRIDRTGAYAARYAAKNVVAAGLAERCEVHLAYAIGRAPPLSVAVETNGTGRTSDDEIAERLLRLMDFRPMAIVRRFRLRERAQRAGNRGFFRPLALYGHVGRADLDLPWEETDLAAALSA